MVCIMSPAKSHEENNTYEIMDDDNDKELESSALSIEEDGMKIESILGGSTIKCKPLFSESGESIIVVQQSNCVQLYSVNTGELVRKFESVNSSLVNVELDPRSKDVLVGCTETGQIIKWKLKKGNILVRNQLKLSAGMRVSAFALYCESSEVKAAVILRNSYQEQQVDFFDAETGMKLASHCNFKLSEKDVILKISRVSDIMAISQEHLIYVTNLKTWKTNLLINAHKIPISCFEFHPEEEMIATGDVTGKIFMWRHLFKFQPLTNLYHWHHTRINAIEFSQSGSSMLSSANEGVLVKWSLNGRDEKTFLPRLPGNAVQIKVSPNNFKVAASLDDNSILIIGNDYSIETSLQVSSVINPGKTSLDKFPAGFKLDPRNQSVVFNGRKGQLQFVSTYNRSLLYNMDIVNQNRLSEEKDKILYDIRVTAMDINIDWLATGEEFNDYECTPELRLKFWEYQKDSKNYALNTNFEIPHNDGFRAIKFSSALTTENLLCVTVGLDNFVKVWSLEDSDNIYKKGKTWICIRKVSYKNQPIESVSFSNDASLLAAGFANNLCIFKTKNMQLKCVLTVPASSSGLFYECFMKIKSKSSNNKTKENVFENFVNSIESGDRKFVKSLSSSKSSAKLLQETDLNKKTKEELHKKILQSSELGFYQKLVTFKNLSLHCKISDNRVAHSLNSRLTTNQINLNKKMKNVAMRNRFKAKYKIKKVFPYTSKCDEIADILKFLNIAKKQSGERNGNVTNGNIRIENGPNINQPVYKLNKLGRIKLVYFCTGEYAHLVVVCTGQRVFIWNLLNFRLQNVLKMSVSHMAFDPITNLFACFTKYDELYVFLPNTPIPVYFKKKIPKIEGAVWVPRRYPQSQSLSVNWQALSTLYFLTDKQELSFLSGSQENTENLFSVVAQNDFNSRKFTIFGALSENTTTGIKNSVNQVINFVGNHEKGAVKMVTNMSANTMPPLRTFCSKFINSMIQIRTVTTSSTQSRLKAASEVNGYSGDKSDDDDGHSDSDENDRLLMKKFILRKSENIKQPLNSSNLSKTNENLLRFIAKTHVNINFE